MKEEIQKLAKQIVAGEKTKKAQIQKLWQFLKEQIKYKATIIADPPKILEKGYGSCIDKTILFVVLAQSLGIKSRYHVILFKLRPVVEQLIEEKPGQIKKLSIDGMLLEKINHLDKIPDLPHTYPEGFSGENWIKLTGPSLDPELQGQFKGGLLPSGSFREDIGAFKTFSDVLDYPRVKRAKEIFLKHPRLSSLILNKINNLLLSFREEKEKGLAQKENVEEIISRAEKFAQREEQILSNL